MIGLVEHCLDLLGSLGVVRARPMMGGHVIYAGALPVALVYRERLYLKVDAESSAAFRAAGGEPFRYELRGRVVEMPYWSAPEDALEHPETMAPWAQLAAAAAARARERKQRVRTQPRRAASAPARGTSGSRRRSRGRSRT